MNARAIPRVRGTAGLCILLAAGAAAFALFPASGFAQEQSVKPGINDRFQDPDAEEFTKIFESESRPIYVHREAIAKALGLKGGMDVADVGAGTGFFSLMMAEKVGMNGTVYAVEIAKSFIDHIDGLAKEEGLANLKTVLCTETSVELPDDSVDAVFICDTYHHFEYPFKTMASIHRAMRPGGRLMIVDFERIKGISIPWVIGHVRCGKGTTTDEIQDAGFDFVKEVDLMDDQYVLIFTKRDAPADE